MKRTVALAALFLAACNDPDPLGLGDDDTTLPSFEVGNLPFPERGAMPDLTVNEPMLASSLVVGTEDPSANPCEVAEACIPGDMGPRDVLRFDVGVVNLGDAHLYIGDPSSNPDDFEYSSCHGHYHHIGFANYELRNSTGVVATGRKQAFCLMDIDDYGNNGDDPMGFNCGNQGISIGWEDVYDSGLDCQFVDITGLPDGDYTLTVTVNAENRVKEFGPAPNAVTVPVTLPLQ